MTQRYMNVKILEQHSPDSNHGNSSHDNSNGETPSGVLNGSAQGGVALKEEKDEAPLPLSNSQEFNPEDEEVLAKLAHAERIGYKVSTV